MKKIIKHTFTIPQLAIIDGELQEVDSIEQTYTFTLLHGGIGVFEENYGKSLISTITKYASQNELEMVNGLLSDTKFIQELASASYVKIEDGKFENNRATAIEFKNLEVFKYLNDTQFIVELLTMASECVMGTMNKPQAQTKKTRKNK